MERQLPKNVRQIGNVSDNPKIYVEDYVDTYLNQLREKAKEQPVGVILVGEVLELEDEKAVFVSGAVQMQELSEKDGKLEIGQDGMKHMMEEAAQYFPESHIVGWGIVEEGNPMSRNREVKKIQEREFGQEGSLFLWKNAREQDEIFYAYKFGELMQIGGHYIYYEKNPEMQNYMINTRKENGVTPSEVVEDRAAKNFRSTMREQMTGREQRTGARFAYMTSALLVVIVLAIGISTMNNYDKMNAVQTSIESLSKSVQQPEGQEAIEKAEVTEEVQADAAEAQADEAETQDAGAEAQDTGQEAQDAGAGTQDSSGEADQSDEPDGAQDAADQAEPVTSTIQEELSSEEYYVVQKGDTLDRISQKIYGTTGEVDAICRMNGLTNGNLIFIGQKLLLP